MAHSHYPLGGTERRLQQRVQHLLPEGEQVRAAVVAFTGPRAGIEALLAPLLGVMSLLINVTRRATTIAVTNRGVVLFDTKGLRRPTRIRERFDTLEPLGPINDTDGDNWVQVAGTTYWIEGIWSSQLYVIRQLKKSATGIGGHASLAVMARIKKPPHRAIHPPTPSYVQDECANSPARRTGTQSPIHPPAGCRCYRRGPSGRTSTLPVAHSVTRR